MPATGYKLSNFEKTYFANDSSLSSNSETFRDVDIKKASCPLNKQWSAIERTLYEEEGEHVTDPELLKECNLWKSTFPHLRVRGKKINVVGDVTEEKILTRNLQPLQNQINLDKIYQKRETIKNRVVGEIVQRLINRFNNSKLPVDSGIRRDGSNLNTNFQVSEVDDEDASRRSDSPILLPEHPVTRNNPISEKKKENRDLVLPSSERESYFERGKQNGDETDADIKKLEQRIYEIFDTWEEETDLDRVKKEIKPDVRRQQDNAKPSLNKGYDLKVPTGDKIGMADSIRSSRGRHKSSLSGDSPAAHIKPFEITTKIDRKYEGLLNKIIERNCGITLDPKKTNCQNLRTTASHQRTESRACFESLEKIRIKSEFNEYYKQTSHNLPKITSIKTRNTWLERSETRTAYVTATNEVPYFIKSKQKSSNATNPHRLVRESVETYTKDEMEEAFFRQLKNEMYSHWKRPPMKSRLTEDAPTRRSKPLPPPAQSKRDLKSSSCGDLMDKNRKYVRQARNGTENAKKDGNLRTRTKFTRANNMQMKQVGNNRGTLPPIETGIICTELVGRPKIGSKTLPKKR